MLGQPGSRPLARVTALANDLIGYTLVSVVALCCDCCLLLALTAAGMHYLVASLVSFSAGSIVAYVLCTRYVFDGRRRQSRELELVGFFAVGVLGLGLTQVLLWLFVSRLALSVAVAKVPTVGLVFMVNFLTRRTLVFVKA